VVSTAVIVTVALTAEVLLETSVAVTTGGFVNAVVKASCPVVALAFLTLAALTTLIDCASTFRELVFGVPYLVVPTLTLEVPDVANSELMLISELTMS
jgi:hypothetical protein